MAPQKKIPPRALRFNLYQCMYHICLQNLSFSPYSLLIFLMNVVFPHQIACQQSQCIHNTVMAWTSPQEKNWLPKSHKTSLEYFYAINPDLENYNWIAIYSFRPNIFATLSLMSCSNLLANFPILINYSHKNNKTIIIYYIHSTAFCLLSHLLLR